MSKKTYFDSEAHEWRHTTSLPFHGKNITGRWQNIPGKGWVFVGTNGNLYTTEDNNGDYDASKITRHNIITDHDYVNLKKALTDTINKYPNDKTTKTTLDNLERRKDLQAKKNTLKRAGYNVNYKELNDGSLSLQVTYKGNDGTTKTAYFYNNDRVDLGDGKGRHVDSGSELDALRKLTYNTNSTSGGTSGGTRTSTVQAPTTQQYSDQGTVKGGNFTTYSGNFSDAFSKAKAAGNKVFGWRGNLYNTVSMDDLNSAGWKPSNLNAMDQKHRDILANAYARANNESLYNAMTNGDKESGITDIDGKMLTFAQLVDKYKKPATPAATTPAATTLPEVVDYRVKGFTNDDIRNLGFNNYQGLVSAAKTNTNNAFIAAMRKRYGDNVDAWDQKRIEGELGVSGKYRRFGGGDYGDMTRSMNDWINRSNELNESVENRTFNGKTYDYRYLADQERRKAKLEEMKKAAGNTGTTTTTPAGTNGTATTSTTSPGDIAKMRLDFINNKDKIRSKKRQFSFKLGGLINYYKHGGNMNQEQLQAAFMQFLAEQTGAQSQEELQAVVQQMGKEGLEQAYAQFMQMMQQQQVQAARFGAKLNYIKRLHGVCPDGMEMHYYKSGGRLCKKCMEMEKKGGHIPEKETGDAIEDFKNSRKKKIQKKVDGGDVRAIAKAAKSATTSRIPNAEITRRADLNSKGRMSTGEAIKKGMELTQGMMKNRGSSGNAISNTMGNSVGRAKKISEKYAGKFTRY